MVASGFDCKARKPLWLIGTPLGRPVVPEVKTMRASSFAFSSNDGCLLGSLVSVS
jgi:hypothetical protein